MILTKKKAEFSHAREECLGSMVVVNSIYRIGLMSFRFNQPCEKQKCVINDFTRHIK